MTLSRRDWLCTVSATAGAAAMADSLSGFAAEGAAKSSGCSLSIGTYSLKGMSLADGIKLVSDIGYDGIEIATQPPYECEPTKLSAERRREIQKQLDDKGLKLTALMENISPAEKPSDHGAELDRLRRVADLAHDLSPKHNTLIQTVLGGGGSWDDRKTLFRARLFAWSQVAQETQTVIAVKPHRGGAFSQPSEAIWLINEIGGSPWLRMVYDYSHYAYRELPLDKTVAMSLPITAHIAVKDAVQSGSKVSFDLPGAAGTIDYARLLKLFYDGGYRGDICCEVSAPGFE